MYLIENKKQVALPEVHLRAAKLLLKRRAACDRLSKEGEIDALWAAMTAFSGYPFYTSKGLKFKYVVKGGEMKVDRKEKTITRSSAFIAYKKSMEMDGIVSGPKKLGVFGSSYLYPVFIRLGVIKSS